MGDEPDVSRATVMLTYEELATRLDIDVQSARRRALRHRWPKTKGNDGRARVAVPATVLPAAGATVAATRATPPATVLSTPPAAVAVTPEILSHLLSQVGELGELRERLGRAEGERDAVQAEVAALRADVARLREEVLAERERADRAEAAAVTVPDLRERAGRAEGEAETLREQLKAERNRSVTQMREVEAARDAAKAELAEWTAGGPLARAWRAFVNRRGQ